MKNEMLHSEKIGGGTEQYLKPVVEVIELGKSDVILTSQCPPYDLEHGDDVYDP